MMICLSNPCISSNDDGKRKRTRKRNTPQFSAIAGTKDQLRHLMSASSTVFQVEDKTLKTSDRAPEHVKTFSFLNSNAVTHWQKRLVRCLWVTTHTTEQQNTSKQVIEARLYKRHILSGQVGVLGQFKGARNT
jgi:hypothetical protein